MDVVERLRSPEVFLDTGGMFSPVAHEAADEIERLREALREAERGLAVALSWSDDDGTWWVANEDVIKVRKAARAALGEEK